MDNIIIDNFLKFLKSDIVSKIKKDLVWLRQSINEDLEKLTMKKKPSKKKDE